MKPLKCHGILTMSINQPFVTCDKSFWNLLRSVTESDDGPLQKDEIDNPTITQFTLKGLDRHSQYRFYLRGLTRVGKGEPIMMTGATTLDGGSILVTYFHPYIFVSASYTITEKLIYVS